MLHNQPLKVEGGLNWVTMLEIRDVVSTKVESLREYISWSLQSSFINLIG